MRYAILANRESRSFPTGDPFLAGAVQPQQADVLVHVGTPLEADRTKDAILVELGNECLGVHTGEPVPPELTNVVGFARYRNGRDAPSNIVELVRRPETKSAAAVAARQVFEAAGFAVAECSDQAGRIIDRLVRPKYNAALRFLDEGLATQEDLDLTCRLGLGYSDGPAERVIRGGLAEHHEITTLLFELTGAAAYAPARASVVAAQRRARGGQK